MNLAPRHARGLFRLEKWYIDTLLADGSVLLVYLGRICVLGHWMSRVTADLFLADGSAIRGGATAGRVAGKGRRLRFGPAAIDDGNLTFETDTLSGRLAFAPRCSDVNGTDPFLRHGRRSLTWAVEIPDADVSGELSWQGNRMPVAGRGYRDRVWYDIPPWQFPVRELVWGRAAAGEHAAYWVRASTGGGLIKRGWIDGVPSDDAESRVILSDSRIILESAVVDLPGLGLGPLRGAAAALARHPFETKWAARADIGGEPGVAIHEIVRWR